MASFDYDIGIIGGGAAGLTIASGAAQLGAKALLVDKEKELGGLPSLRVCSQQNADQNGPCVSSDEICQSIWVAVGGGAAGDV